MFPTVPENYLDRANRIIRELEAQGFTKEELRRLSYLVLVNQRLEEHVNLGDMEVWKDEQEARTNGHSV